MTRRGLVCLSSTHPRQGGDDYALSLASGRDKGVATKLGEFFTVARRSGLWPEGQSPHRSALTKARAKIPHQAFETLLKQAVALAYEVFPPREEYLWQGLSVFAFDGST